MSTEKVIENEEVTIDDFIDMPGADSVISNDGTTEVNVFSKTSTDTSFLNPEEIAAKKKEEEEAKILDKVITDVEEEEIIQSTTKKGRPTVDKSGLVDTFSKLIEENVLMGFDEEKPLEEYTVNDFKDLLLANFEEREKAIREQTPEEFFKSLPQEMQYAAEYIMKGGQDMKGLFKALAQVEEQHELDPTNEAHQVHIARQYLQASRFGTPEEIEEQLQEWEEANLLGKKAQQFKVKLDDMAEEIVRQKIEQAEIAKQVQTQKKEQYKKNIFDTLSKEDINGIKMDNKKRNFLWNELTSTNYQSITGRPTNLFGMLIEKHQFSETPNYDLIIEATMLLYNPEEYKNMIRQSAVNDTVEKTVRQLKTEQGRKNGSSSQETAFNDASRQKTNTIPRKQRNIFER